jgi:hypothetical protein
MNCFWIFSLLLLLSACASLPDQAVRGRSFFYVGGTYVGSPGKEVMQGQMYVEKLEPQQVKQPYPLVLIHGASTNCHQLDDDTRWSKGVG